MELRDLRAFVTLAEVLHFGQAAARLNVTQSALSKQIRRLEQVMGGVLFERNASHTRLSDLGRALQGEARVLIQKSDQLVRTAQDIRAGVCGTLRIGFGVATQTLVPRAVARFRQERPQVKVALCDLSSHHQLLAISEGALDLGFCRLPVPKGWVALPVVKAQFVAVMPCTEPPLSGLSDLARLPLALIERAKAPSFYDQLMRYLAARQHRVAEIQYISDFAAGVALAAAGMAWTVVPSSLAIAQPMVRTLALDEPGAVWTVGLVRPSGPASALVEAFWHIVEEVSGEQ